MLRIDAMLRQTALALSALACGTGPQKVIEPAVPVEYWDLSTGSHIAYFHVPAAARKTRAAVVFVHGGPGAYQVASYDVGKEWYAHLAQLGFAIYAYDQVGSGLSGRLADPAEYSVSRHVADLAAIVQKIGAQRLVLIGDSWGATLVAHYIAAHPGTVTKAIFTSPGALDPADWNAPSEHPGSIVRFCNGSRARPEPTSCAMPNWIGCSRATYARLMHSRAIRKWTASSARS